MRFRGVVFVSLVCIGMPTFFYGLVKAQVPGRGTALPRAQARTNTAAAPQVRGNLAQVMRGVMFPNSNVIFFAQSKNPADVKPAEDSSLATDPLSGTYGGWAAVENSSIALAEAANLLIIPGRVCSNGRPVPLKNPDWAKFVQELRDASMVAYKAAQAKDQDKILDAADAITTACSNCHMQYRDKTQNVDDRCM